MQFELKNLPQSQIELTIKLSHEEMLGYFDQTCEQLARQANVKGFRPGYAPKDVVARELGEEKIKKAAADLAIRESFSKAVAENNWEVVGEPKIEPQPVVGEGLVYKTTFAVVPNIILPDYKKINVPLVAVKIEEKEIDSVLRDIQKSRAVLTAAARPAQKGDRLEIDFTAKVDGKIIAGGESQQHPLILGEGHFMAGFEDNLVGLNENETKNFSVAAPVDYHDKNLAQKKVDFEVKINSIQDRQLPEITDEFAQSIGNFASVGDLKNNVREGLQAEKTMRAQEERRAKIAQELVKNIAVELPARLVEMEIEKMTTELEGSLARLNLNRETYLNHIGATWVDLKKDWQTKAEQRVKITLALREIAKKEGLRVSEEETEEKLTQILRGAPAAPGQNIDLTALRGYVRGLIRNDKVFALLEKGN